ncbi:hypothetical protein HaLaN_02056 [Haematococcus lacustris]|uniref:Uncharacterized protein n=1 Tax=Haematococcus lacustris TaxID=44745 RepID=A0A699YK52_HAELA|nr:hypothetical protein HaLaN_02056 [Haematococcus lacustris]
MSSLWHAHDRPASLCPAAAISTAQHAHCQDPYGATAHPKTGPHVNLATLVPGCQTDWCMCASCAVQLEEEAAIQSQKRWRIRKQLVVFFGNAGIGTRGGWGAKAVLQACRKVVERPNSGGPTDRVKGKVVTVDELRTSRVSSAMNSPQPCEEELDRSKPTRLEGSWSKRFEAPVRGLMWCPASQSSTSSRLGRASGAHWSCAGGNTKQGFPPRAKSTQHWAREATVMCALGNAQVVAYIRACLSCQH